MSRLYRLVRADGRSYGTLVLEPDLTVAMVSDSNPQPGWNTPLLADTDLTDAERWQIARFERSLDDHAAVTAQHLSAADEWERRNELNGAYHADVAAHRALIALGLIEVAR